MKRLTLSIAAALLCILFAAAPASADFGLKDLGIEFTEADGSQATQAGSHPYAFTTKLAVNGKIAGEEGMEFPDGELRTLRISQPTGMVGDRDATPHCSGADFVTINQETSKNACPDATAVGYAAVRISLFDGIEPGDPRTLHVPVFNLVPRPGTAATLGFVALKLPVTIDVGVSHSPPYNIAVSLADSPQGGQFLGSEVTIWGVPGDPSHDPFRGSCLDALNFSEDPVSQGTCKTSLAPRPFLTLPRSCSGPLTSHFEASSWQSPALVSGDASTPLGIDSCSELLFGPTIAARPTTTAAESAAGLEFDVDVEDEGLTSPTSRAQSDIKKIVTTFPEGMTVNPSAGEGLGACSLAQYNAQDIGVAPGVGCPEDSKIGTVRVDTPLLQNEPLEGSVYIAKQYENPFDSLLALYIAFENPELGISIKQAGRMEADPETGRLTSTFEDIPQFPFSHLALRVKTGPRSPLVTPSACGRYAIEAELTPWSGNAPITATSTFDVTSGPNGSPCPGGSRPFHPGFEAGSTNNNAGSYSPFNLRLTRSDGEEEITKLSPTLPPGVVGKIAGMARCSEAAIAAARSKSGREELASPSCPADSRMGRTLAGAGVGSSLTYAPGSIYLAGPFRGAPLSAVAVSPAVAGPFDLGTVVIRLALNLNPTTAVVEIDGAGSEPIPRILAGIPLRLRDLRVYVDRPDFTLNPTSCDPASTKAAVFGSGGGAPVSVASRYQAANCAALGFKPALKLRLKGGTKRGDHPALHSVLTPRRGDANIGKAVVTLPRSEFIDSEHVNNPCTRVQFNAGNCPKVSVLGTARATSPLLDEPLEGPVYFRSNGGERLLPDVVADLHGLFRIILIGKVDSKGGRVRATFDEVPDAPVTKFNLDLYGGKRGLLVNSRNLCAQKNLSAKLTLTGQNGKELLQQPALKTDCKKKKPKKG